MNKDNTSLSKKDYKEIYKTFTKEQLVDLLVNKTYQVIELSKRNFELLIKNNEM